MGKLHYSASRIGRLRTRERLTTLIYGSGTDIIFLTDKNK
jgi:hypothetical protein